MRALALAVTLFAAAASAAEQAQLRSADQLYMRRDHSDSLARSTQQLRAAHQQNPGDYEIAWRLGRNLVEEGKRKASKEEKLAGYAEAQQVLKQAIEIRPGDAQAHYWLASAIGNEADIKRTLGLAKAMKAELEKAVELDPKHADAHQMLCEALRQIPGMFGGDKKRAVSECEEAARLTPNTTSRYPALAEAYKAVHRKDEAVAAAKKTFEVAAPDDPASAEGDKAGAHAVLKDLGAE